MKPIDDIEVIRELDPGNMYNSIFDMPEQMDEAFKIAGRWEISADQFAEVGNIIVIGMGGSAIGGDLLRTLLSSQLLIPFHVCRHYRLPEYVDDESLVIVSSYSGNTEETLSAFEDALDRKAMIAGITTGGMLEETARLNEVPYLKIPPGLQPRAALGYSLVPIMVFLEKIGLIESVADQLARTIKRLMIQREKYIESESSETNTAKMLAEMMHEKMPIIYGGPTLTDVVAMRWKGQICENSKNMAFANQYAEFNHNELVGYNELIARHKDHLMVVQLRDKDDHPKITRRMEIVAAIIRKLGVEVVEIDSVGELPLERIFSLIQLGDFVSYYLAILNGVDPTPVEAIETLKEELAG